MGISPEPRGKRAVWSVALLFLGAAAGVLLMSGDIAQAGGFRRLDMTGLLDRILAEQTSPAEHALTPVSPVNRMTFRTRAGNAATPFLTVPVQVVPLKEDLPEPVFVYHVIGPIAYTEEPYSVPFWQGPEHALAGPAFSNNYFGALDVGRYVPAVGGEAVTLPIYTLAGSVQASREGGDLLVWGDIAATAPSDALTVNVETLDADWADPDNNGLPRSLFETVDANTCWAAVVRGAGGGNRAVFVRSLRNVAADKADGDMVTLQPRENVTVVVPGLNLLVGAGLVEPTDEVVAVVEVADIPDDLIDAVTGDLYPDISAWSQAVRETAPGLIPDNAPYVQVVLLSRDRGPLESLGTLFCTLVVSGLQWPSGSDNAGISVHGVRTVLQVESEENTYFTNHPDGPLWQLADAQPTVSRDSGLILARVNMAGAFIPVVSGIRIDASVPPVLPPNVPVPVTLRGRFPLTAAADPATGMTLEEAQQAYELFFTDENVTESSMIPASFRSVNTPSGPVAVTPLDEEDGNLLFLTSPDLSALLGEAAQRPVCLLVRAKQNAGDSYLLRGLQVRAVATLETEVSGDGSGTVSVVVSQPEFGLENVSELGDSAALSLGAGVYWAGSRVTATARPNEQSALTGWLVNGINRGDGSVNPLTFTLAVGENTLEAQFHPLVTDRFRLSLEPVSGGVVTVTPVQPETGYPAGTQVTLTAVNNPGNRFVGWTGNLGGVNPSQPVITVTMNEDRTVGAVFIPETNYYLFVHQPEMGGEILADPQPSAAGYLPGVAVTLTAVADDLYVFDRWTGDVDDPQANPATVVMDADRDVGVLFHPPLRVLVSAGTGGTVTVETVAVGAENVDAQLPYGSTVRITAVPDSNYTFKTWTGPGAALMDDPTQPSQEITLSGDLSLTAEFESSFDVESIEPDWAWLFGGVTATVRGKGLRDGMTALFDGMEATLYNAAPDGTSAVVAVPAFAGTLAGASAAVTFRVRDGDSLTPSGRVFTYWQYRADTSGILATAFVLETPSAGGRVPLLAENGDLDTAALVIPPLNVSGPLYGVVLLQRVSAAVKVDTAVPTGSLAGSRVDAPGAADSGIPGMYDFSVYFYRTAAEAPAVGGAATLESADALVAAVLSRTPAADGTPTAGSSIRFVLPAGQSNLTYTILRAGARVFGVSSSLDYVGGVESYEEPLAVRYESTVLDGEVYPAPDVVSAADARPETVEARIYAPGGFRLVQGALLPERTAGLVRVAKVNGLPGAPARGPKKGGTVLTLYAGEGGLAYIDRIELVGSDGRRVTVDESRFLSKNGQDEFVFEFRTPRSPFTGAVDMYIYLESDPGQPAVILQRAFEYTPNPLGAMPFFLMLLALLSLVIGMAFGL